MNVIARVDRAMKRLAGGRPLVLLVDEAEHLDARTAAAVHQVVATGTACAIVTVRVGQFPPEPLAGLWRNGRADWLEVGPLHEAAVDSLLQRVLGGDLDGALTHGFWVRSGGNALMLRELVHAARNRGGADRARLAVAARRGTAGAGAAA